MCFGLSSLSLSKTLWVSLSRSLSLALSLLSLFPKPHQSPRATLHGQKHPTHPPTNHRGHRGRFFQAHRARRRLRPGPHSERVRHRREGDHGRPIVRVEVGDDFGEGRVTVRHRVRGLVRYHAHFLLLTRARVRVRVRVCALPRRRVVVVGSSTRRCVCAFVKKPQKREERDFFLVRFSGKKNVSLSLSFLSLFKFKNAPPNNNSHHPRR